MTISGSDLGEASRSGGENPLLAYLGIELIDWEPLRARFSMEVRPHHLNRGGSLQGGVIATILDAACGYAGLWQDDASPAQSGVTAMLAISFLARVRSGRVIADGRISVAGRSLYFAEGALVDANGELIATAQGTFKKIGPRANSSM